MSIICQTLRPIDHQQPNSHSGHFDFYNKSVLYEFGYGLSYTTFSMAQNMTITPTFQNTLSALPPSAKTVPGGNPHLWDELYQISTTVKNTGHTAGATVPQLYLSIPKLSTTGSNIEAVKVLRGFNKIRLQPGESKTATFQLTRRDISRWDVVRQQWVIPEGSFKSWVGFSSRDFRASGSFTPLS